MALVDLLRRGMASLRERASVIGAYFSTLYYLEIIYLMMVLLFIFGKPLAAVAAIALALLLSVHIVRLYNTRPGSRLVQLAIMDVHAALSLAFLVTLAVRGGDPGPTTWLTALVRGLMLLGEIPLIVVMGRRGDPSAPAATPPPLTRAKKR